MAFGINAFGQVPANDDPANATLISNVTSNCSADGAYSSKNATATFTSDSYKDVWFQFTATAFDVSVTVTANGASPLLFPGVDIFTIDTTIKNYVNIVGAVSAGSTVTTLYKGGLTIGQTYYIRVYGLSNNTGTFKLCINNYNPVLQPGQDYSSASVLCNKNSFTQTGVTGAGLNAREAAGTCIDYSGGHGPIEANTAWYKWTAANNGTLTFTITPTVLSPIPDDIDWVLFDLGTTGDAANVNAANAIRCDASRGVDCVPPNPVYYKTGLRDGETHTSEPAGCGPNQDGYDETLTMIQGHVYALLVNNFSNGNNGFTLDFGGTGQFAGPAAAFSIAIGAPCTAGQIYTFTNLSTNYQSLSWSFGTGASPATATGNGPFNVSYSTLGQKTVVLQATGGKGCIVVADTTFTVGLKPPKPPIDTLQRTYCLLDTLVLKTPSKPNYTYQWTGPNNFSSTDSIIHVPLTSYNLAGKYILSVTANGCTSDTSSVTFVHIGQLPVADFSISQQNLCSATQSFNITNLSTNYTSLQWNYGTDANTATAVNSTTNNITYSSTGTKTITLTATGDKGCVTVVSKTLVVPQKPSTPTIVAANTQYCIGDSIRLSTPAQANTTYTWSGPKGFTATTAKVAIAVTDASVAGTYSLIITQGLCSSDAASITIGPSQIIAVPVASFTATPAIPANLAIPATVSFTNTTINADTYLWDFGDGTTSTLANPSHIYNSKGNYTVTLTATNKGLCTNSIFKGQLIVRYDVTVFIPNTFTPNADSHNDEFVVKITSLKTFNIKIFNRYGKMLFESNDISNNWRGTFNNQNVPVGTYYYIINCVTLNDDTLTESGYVTVIR